MPGTSIADTERRLALEWSAPGEFSSPTEVLIPAGANGTTFAVEALDDSVVEGLSRVLLTARMAGFAPAEMEFKLDDNESGNLRLSLPSSIREGTIHMEEPCWVSMPAAVQHDTEVALVGFGRLHPPARVIVPAGAQSARFNLRILNDRYNNLPPMDDRFRATTSGWPPAVASMAVVDDDARGFTLQLPQRVLEGIPSTAKVQFYAPFDRPVTLRITSSPSGLDHPSQMTVPAGTSLVDIPLSKADDLEASRNIGVQLLVQVDGIDIQGASLGVIDNDSPAQSLSMVVDPRGPKTRHRVGDRHLWLLARCHRWSGLR